MPTKDTTTISSRVSGEVRRGLEDMVVKRNGKFGVVCTLSSLVADLLLQAVKYFQQKEAKEYEEKKSQYDYRRHVRDEDV